MVCLILVGGLTKTAAGTGQSLFDARVASMTSSMLKKKKALTLARFVIHLVSDLGSTVQSTTKGAGSAINDTTDSAAESLGGKEQTGQNPLGLSSDAK